MKQEKLASLCIAVLVGWNLLFCVQPAGAQTDADIAQERREMAQRLLSDTPIDVVIKLRYSCVTGQEPKRVMRDRGFGSVSLPDASDECVATLARVAREGRLLSYYQGMLNEVNGHADGFERLPAAIGAITAKAGVNQVPVGNKQAIIVSPALALDAGFTTAFQKSEQTKAAIPDVVILKPVAERCLAQDERDLGLCYSIGYMYGMRFVNRMP